MRNWHFPQIVSATRSFLPSEEWPRSDEPSTESTLNARSLAAGPMARTCRARRGSQDMMTTMNTEKGQGKAYSFEALGMSAHQPVYGQAWLPDLPSRFASPCISYNHGGLG